MAVGVPFRRSRPTGLATTGPQLRHSSSVDEFVEPGGQVGVVLGDAARVVGRQPNLHRSPSGLSPAEAYRRLDLENGADESEVRQAYRRKVKEVHPDRGGDEVAFKRVTEAYETLVE